MRRDQTAWNIISRLIPGTVVVGRNVSLMVVDHLTGKGRNMRGYVDLERGRFSFELNGLIRSNEEIQVLSSVGNIPAPVVSRSVQRRLVVQRKARKRSSKPQWGLSNAILSTVTKNPNISGTQVLSLMLADKFEFNTSNPLGSITGLLKTMIDKKLMTRERVQVNNRNTYHYTALLLH